MQTISRISVFAVLFLAFTAKAKAQPGSVWQQIDSINAFYDSAHNLGFDVRFVYDSDTLLGNYQHREQEGSFLMDRNRFYYKLNFTECVQGDSFMLTIMEPEQLIMAGPPTPFGAKAVLPIRRQLDSLVHAKLSDYTSTIGVADSLKVIRFTATDSAADYTSIALYYDSVTYALKKYELGFDYYTDADSSELGELIRPGPQMPRHLKLTILFENYRVAILPEEIFDLDRYIKVNGVNEWVGKGKYRDYTVSTFNR